VFLIIHYRCGCAIILIKLQHYWKRCQNQSPSQNFWAPYQDPASLSRLELSLVNTKATNHDASRYPSQAATRGGIGVYLATGSSRGSLTRLPEALKATKAWQQSEASLHSSSRPHSMAASRPPRVSNGATDAPDIDIGMLTARAAASVVVGGGALVPEAAKREWERVVAHPCNFVSTGRQTKTHDVKPASKWAAISFFEVKSRESLDHIRPHT